MKQQYRFIKLFVKNFALNSFAYLPIKYDTKLKIMNLFNINIYNPEFILKKYILKSKSSYSFLNILENYFKKNENENNFFRNKYCLEYGPGLTLDIAQMMRFYGAKVVICCDIYPFYDETASLEIRTLLKNKFEKKYNKDFFIDEVKIINKDFIEIEKLKPGIYYIYNNKAEFNFTRKFDLIYSKAVMEHVSDLDSFFKTINSNLNSGGYLFSSIDFKSHGINYKSPFDHLFMNNLIWKLISSKRNLHNRKLWSYYLNLFKKYNFKLIYEKKNNYSADLFNNNVNKIKNMKYDLLDLKISSVYFLAKKFK